MKSVFLWNSVDLSTFEFSENFNYIENFFGEIFKPYRVIYLSRARHFIPMILQYENMKRNNIIFTQPYSSHCVLSNLSLQATPSVINDNYIDGTIIYHQYGNITKVKNGQYKNILIEDSVDSIFLDVTHNELFPNDGKYTIISLPKIMKIPFGAILICKDENDYKGIKELLDVQINKISSSVSIYESLKKNDYHKETILNQFKQIVPIVNNIDEVYDNCLNIVKQNVKVISQYYNLSHNYSKRLPSNIILNDKYIVENKLSRYIQEPYRFIYDYKNEISIKKALIPVHSGVDWSKVL